MTLNLKNKYLNQNILNIYFLIIFSFIPISIIIGPAVSLSNILLIIVSFLFIFLDKNNLPLLKDKIILLLICLYFYLIFNSFVSINFEISAQRNIGFLRYIILFITINYFFLKQENHKNLMKYWMLIISVVLFDVIWEFYTGQNILGYEATNKKRIVSFFKDETIVAAFINGFIFILIGYLFVDYENKNKLQKILISFFIIIAIICILFSGERSNTLKFLIGLSIFFGINNKIKIKHKIFFVLTIVCILIFSFFKFTEIKHRYYNDLVLIFADKEKRNNYIYFQLYNSGIEVFKENPAFGVGNKNYRVRTCGMPSEIYICNSHPHQIYIEFLSEHGIIGTIILMGILFYLLFNNLKIILLSRNFLQIGCLSYLITVFIPMLPSGSFFSDFNATLFWINFSLFYASNPKTNIFRKFYNLN